ncbi:MAG: DUF547 domain-containing protein [Saprospiraceae bacterium]|nr:DUF547 domain-containing protein [Saprospiraceae bacterium]
MQSLKYIGYGIVTMGILVLVYMISSGKNINELGLEILSKVKSAKGDKVNLEAIIPSPLKTIDHSDWAYLMQKHVKSDGKVDYRGITKNKSYLTSYLQMISQNPPAQNWSKEESLAYWINAYNAFTIRLILDHYPVKSIKDIADGLPMINSPWDIKFFTIGGVPFDLNTIEHEILRKQFDEPRIHFAINCASTSCPVLRNEAYLPKYLEFQLEDQANVFINDPNKNVITDTSIQLSKIFNWFAGDFTKKESLHSFLSAYHSNINADAKISYLPYDWSLNNTSKRSKK